MSAAFAVIALTTLAGALGTIALRQIVHCILCLAITFTGVAMLYLQLGAQFLGFAQFLVYIGAVTILILFAILLTRNTGPNLSESPFSTGLETGLIISGSVFACLIWMIQRTPTLQQSQPADSELTVKMIGDGLMTKYIIPLEIVALLLTVAMIGAVIIAMKESTTPNTGTNPATNRGSPPPPAP
ncbi:MAG: NADH-quinone oxidoreductase subunit 10 [Verrucomicrobia subdivision 3 bacterium]|nr:NADH-quinone oxidoreductase subunit 10 [Limisphaerales bacterium]MCS1414441.1 NADH-quinone oxidoreductase subunit 10 [Limisphaerales bacterium]